MCTVPTLGSSDGGNSLKAVRKETAVGQSKRVSHGLVLSGHLMSVATCSHANAPTLFERFSANAI